MIKTSMKRLAVVFAVFGLAACGEMGQDVTGPVAAGEAREARTSKVPMTFNVQGDNNATISASAFGGVRSINVQGAFQTGNPCYNISAAATRSGSTVTMKISAVSNGRICIQMVQTWTYTSQLTNLSAGTYRLRVINPDNAVALDQYVRVN